MKAILVEEFGGPEVLRVRQIPDPVPGPGEVLIAVKAIGVNPVETYIRSGQYPQKPNLPFTPGTDAAGVVEAAGNGVKFRPGDRVYTDRTRTGAYAEKTAANSAHVFALPKALSFEQGASIGVPYATAHYALFARGSAKDGETVLIHGASGGVGSAAVQLARASGLTVIGTGGGAEGAAFVRSLGAHHAFDHRKAGYLDEIVKASGGRGPDLILEMLANVNLPADLSLAAPRGRIVVVGSRGEVAINPRIAMMKDLSILGMSLNSGNLTEAERLAIHADLAKGFADGSLRPIINRSFALADAPRAHEAILSSGARGKIILQP